MAKKITSAYVYVTYKTMRLWYFGFWVDIYIYMLACRIHIVQIKCDNSKPIQLNLYIYIKSVVYKSKLNNRLQRRRRKMKNLSHQNPSFTVYGGHPYCTKVLVISITFLYNWISRVSSDMLWITKLYFILWHMMQYFISSTIFIYVSIEIRLYKIIEFISNIRKAMMLNITHKI